MLTKNIKYVCFTCVTLSLVSCDKVKDLADHVAKEAEAEIASVAENSKIEHSNAAVEALQNSFGSFDNSYERYISWVKTEGGPTGKELIKFGMPKVTMYEGALEKIDLVIEKKDYPTLSEAAAEYKKTMPPLYEVVEEAHKYYSREDFKDDDMAKGRELHVKMMPLFDAYFEKQAILRDALGVIQDKDIAEALEKAKSEGRVVEYGIKNILRISDEIVDLGNQEDLSKVSVSELQKRYDELIKFIEELNSSSDKLTDQEKSSLNRYTSSAENYEVQVKKFIRTFNDSSELRAQVSALDSVLDRYNDLVGSYNSIVSDSLMTK